MMDVARTAGVAASTVSHVVNNTRFVHPDTRAAVEAAIGYITNTIARSLARSRTGTVGLAISLEPNPYFVALVHEIVAGWMRFCWRRWAWGPDSAPCPT